MAEKEKVSIYCAQLAVHNNDLYNFKALGKTRQNIEEALSFNFSHCNGRLVDSVE